MNFAHPSLAALGLGAVAVPILIHILMRRRRRPIQWGAMRWLAEAYRRQRRRLRFEQWLLLAARCLAIALVGLAVARPLLGGDTGAAAGRATTLYVLLDNSLTAGLTDAGGSAAFERLRKRADDMLATLDGALGDRAGLVTLAGPPEAAVAPASADIQEVRRLLSRLEGAHSRADIGAALEAVRGAVASAPDDDSAVVIALMTDAREGSADLTRSLKALDLGPRAARVLVTPAAAEEVENTAIASVRLTRPFLVTGEDAGPDASRAGVRVELRRWGALGAGVSKVRVGIVSARGATPATAEALVRWQPGQASAQATVNVPASAAAGGGGPWAVEASIDADAIAADNTAWAPLLLRESLSVAIAAPAASDIASPDSFTPADWMALALAPGGAGAWQAGGVRVWRVEPRELTPQSRDSAPVAVRDADALIVTEPQTLDGAAWAGVKAFGALGSKLIVVAPPRDAATQTWPDGLVGAFELPWTIAHEPRELAPPATLATSVQGLEPDADLLTMIRPELEELARPVRVSRAMTMRTGGVGSALVNLSDGSPLLVSTPVGPSRLVLWLAAPALTWTDLPAKPLMVPLVQELVRQGVGSGGLGAIEAGSAAPVVQSASDLAPWRGDGRAVALSSAPEPMRHAGVWTVRSAEGASLGALCVNADADASATAPQDPQRVLAWLAGPLGPDAVQVLDAGPAAGGDPGAAVRSARAGADTSGGVSLWLFVAAGVIAVVEAVLARVFSHAGIDAQRAAAPGGTR